MPRLFGESIVLREYRWEDLDGIRNWVNDSEVTQFLSGLFLYPHTLHQSENYLRMMIEQKSEARGFVIADKDTLEYIGQIDWSI